MWSRALLVCVLATGATAQVQLHPLFQDHMVLQRGRAVPVWGTAKAGEKVRVQFAGQDVSCEANADGRWSVELAALTVGKPRQLVVSGQNKLVVKDILVGEVWLCSGQSNMVWPMTRSNDAWQEIRAANHPQMRLFQVRRRVAKNPMARPDGGPWKVCTPETVRSFSAVAYFFGRHLHRKLGVPVGLVQSAVGGTPAEAWTSAAALDDPDFAAIRRRWRRLDTAQARYRKQLEAWQQAVAQARQSGAPVPAQPKKPGNPMHTHRASGLFNGMIAPLLPFAFRGAIWYQGEANVGRAWQYRKLFQTMIQDWRHHFRQEDMPFFWVQLAAFRYGRHDKRACAELWEAQSMALGLPGTGQAVAMDLGNPWDIHPRNKQDVGYRLGLAAEAVAYGRKVVHSGPVYRKMRVDGARAVLEFDHVGGGLVGKSQKLGGFEVAGADQKFHPATASIDGDTVVVISSEVEKPVAVRYAWHDTAVASLYNKAGLPASAFRTDQWRGVTEPKR